MVAGIGSQGVEYVSKIRNNISLNPPEVAQILVAKDEIAISDRAREMYQWEKEITLAKKRVEGATQEDLREERIEEAKKRLQSGFYNQKEVIEVVAGKIARAVNN